MWWARAAAVGLLCLAASACGFEPLYGQRTRSFDPELAAIRVDPIPERVGQLLANSLRDGFNPTGERVPSKYGLSVTLTATRTEVGIRKDGTASRVQLELRAYYTLRDAGNRSVFTANGRSATAYEISDNEYANVVSEQDSRERLVRDLSDDILTRVRAFLTRQEAA